MLFMGCFVRRVTELFTLGKRGTLYQRHVLNSSLIRREIVSMQFYTNAQTVDDYSVIGI